MPSHKKKKNKRRDIDLSIWKDAGSIWIEGIGGWLKHGSEDRERWCSQGRPSMFTKQRYKREVQIISDCLAFPRLLTGQWNSQGQRACPRLEIVLRVPRAGNKTGNACQHPQTSIYPACHAPYPPLFSQRWFPLKRMPFPLLCQTPTYPSRSPYLSVKSFPGSPMVSQKRPALLCPYYVCVLTERKIRDWKTWTDISIQQVTGQFTPWLSFFRCN